MRTLLKYIPFLFLVACGTESDRPLDFQVSPKKEFKVVRELSLESYFTRFEAVIGLSTQKISTEFAKLEYPYVGLCLVWTNGERKIEVDPDFWAAASDLEKENLIFHEAGHCALNLLHIEDLVEIDSLSVPKSIMYPFLFGGTDSYRNHTGYYHEELKSHVHRKRSN